MPLNAAQRAGRKGQFPYYGANGLVDYVNDYLFDGHYVLLAEDGGYFDDPSRAVAYEATGRFWVNNHAHILQPLGGVPHAFLRGLLNATNWLGYVGGSTRLKLTQGGLQQVSVRLPPLTEQRRIVAKIDSLTAKSARARNNLDHTPRLVEKYKQAVITAAFRGDLTQEWRGQNQCRPLGGRNVYGDVPLDDSERGAWTSDELPRTWEWRDFQGVFLDVTDSTRKLQQKSYLASGLYPVIDQGEKEVGGYTDREELVHRADPPYVIFGDHTRCIKFIEHRFVQGADGVKVLKGAPGILPKYGRLALSAASLPDKGYSRHMKFVRATLFPIAPVEEQSEIVRRIETAFAWIDRLTKEATSARKLVDHLDQAVLAKAFRGELVPQDPNDEPATALLDRIRAERAKAVTPGRHRRA